MSSPADAVLAPIRRWVLYSRTNLTITVVATLTVLVVTGRVFGHPDPPRHHDPATANPTAAATATRPISFELVEVTDSQVTAKTTPWVTSSAPATAMAYVHAYLDQAPSQTNWLAKITQFTTETPGADVAAKRPTVLVAITGATRSKMTTDGAGAKLARVEVPTQAGTLAMTLTVADNGRGQHWLVAAPLPTLDPGAIAHMPPATTTVSTTTPAAVPPAVASTARPTPPAAGSATPPPLGSPAPSSAPGNIPAPDLDTPLPGAL
ncbi:hypothetical protein [Nocardia tengchongensis]|uniref:hypothetical protein n=1 Tax=Nocardia tengchongensis TaxID=2055889 RepID=UPI00365F61F8